MFYYRTRKRFSAVWFSDYAHRHSTNEYCYLGYEYRLSDPEIEERDLIELGEMGQEAFMLEYGNVQCETLSRWNRLSSYPKCGPEETKEPRDRTDAASAW